MPKKMVTGQGAAGGGLGATSLPLWHATGLSLAVIVAHVLNGWGAIVFGLFSAAVIWTLHRLHRHAPEARTTAGLIASAPKAAPAAAIVVVQFVAYVLIGAYTAKTVASMALVITTPADATSIPGWWGPTLAVAVAAVAAVLVAALPTRLLAPTVTALAAFGLLVIFYVALALIARILSGTSPVDPVVQIGATPAAAEWGPAALLVSLAIAFAGFEIPTTVNDRLRSVGRPLGVAMALVTVCAGLAWVAANLASAGEFRYDAADFILVAAQLFGDTANMWLLGAILAQAVAALLVLIWGATRVIRPSDTYSLRPLALTAAVTTVLALAVSFDWGGAAGRLWGVAPILLFVVYLAAAHANSQLDDSDTTAWAVFALTGIVLVVVVFLNGVSHGWWPLAIAAAVAVTGVAVGWIRNGVSQENRTA